MDKKIFTTRVKTNLDGVLQTTQTVNGIMMTGDNAANQIIVELYKDYDPFLLPANTKIVGYFIRSDGYTVEVDGEVTTEGEAKVIIPEVAYQISGSLSIAVRVFDDPRTIIDEGVERIIWDTKIVIASLSCYVQLTETNSIIDPTHHIPDVQELLAYIDRLNEMRADMILEEEHRVIAETGRVNAEEARVAAESARDAAEQTRETQEATRASTFTTNEANRQSTFESNEANRETTASTNESTRQSTFESNEAARESTASTNEAKRVSTFTTNEANRESTASANESTRQSTFETNETARQSDYDIAEAARQAEFDTAEATRQANELIRQSQESTRQSQESTRQSNESTRQSQEATRETTTANTLYKIDEMTVEFERLPEYSEPYATITEVDGPDTGKKHKHLKISMAPGDPFVIARTFASVAEMQAYTGTDIRPGQFVIINTDDVQDPDDAKMYMRTQNSWAFITDLSGARGIQGPQGITGNGIASIEMTQNYTLLIHYTDGNTYETGNIRGVTGNGVSGASIDSTTYYLTLSYTDGNSTTIPVRLKGDTGDTGNGISDASIDPTTHYLTLDYTDGTSTTIQVRLKGETGDTGNGIESASIDSTTYKLTLNYTDGTSETIDTPIRGQKGERGASIESASIDPVTYQMTITFDDGVTYTTPFSMRGPKGEPGAAGTQFTYDSEDHSLVIEYF